MNNKECVSYLIGSQNYNLHDSTSDKDYKSFVLPTFDDIYYGNKLNEHVANDKGIKFYKSIKELPNLLFKKASFNNLELLYSVDKVRSERFIEIDDWLNNNRDEIFKANLPRLFDSTIGEAHSRIKNVSLGKSCPSTVHLVEKYGYDTKDAMHAFRQFLYLRDVYENNSPESIIFINNNNRECLLDIKNGIYDKDECIKCMLSIIETLISSLKDYFHSFKFNEDLYQEFDNMIKQLIRNNL